MKLTLLTPLILLLGACTSVVPSALARLNQLSPLESDPADIAVALDLPDRLDIKPGTATIGFRAERKDIGEVSTGTYVLRQREDKETGLVIFDIEDADQRDMRAQQSLVRLWKEKAPRQTSGSVSVAFQGCAIGTGPADEAEVSILMRTEQGGEFFPLVRGASMKDVLNILEVTEIDPC